jgi:hypothetical protein
MWVFDGEEWCEEGVTHRNSSPPAGNLGEFYPELQVEIVEIPQTIVGRDIPPFPFPLP